MKTEHNLHFSNLVAENIWTNSLNNIKPPYFFFRYSILFIGCISIFSCIQNSEVITITKDCYSLNLSPNLNTGLEDVIYCQAWTRNGISHNANVYLDFDLESISKHREIKSIQLKTTFFVKPGSYFKQYEGQNDLLIRIISSDWDEDSLTFIHKPEVFPEFEYLVPGPGNQNIDFSIDLEPVYDYITANNLPFYGIRMEMADKTPYKIFFFGSKEYLPNYQSRIVVEYY